MTRDYQDLLPRVLEAMYPEASVRRKIIGQLSDYGKESYHREIPRVQLGILKLAWSQPSRLDAFIELACQDYRDLLCAAEFPLSSRDYRLKDQDPVKYKEYQLEEAARYDAWLELVLSGGY